jgi:hypothetical protein
MSYIPNPKNCRFFFSFDYLKVGGLVGSGRGKGKDTGGEKGSSMQYIYI